jgi:3-hydroxy acid dehydrogenase / malonic semialdehyde reductase
MTSLAGKTALVTGSSSGIGLAIAQTLLKQSCRVIGIARDHSKTDIEDPLFTAYDQDLSNLKHSESLIKSLCKEHTINIFVHCAGEGLFGSIEQFSIQQIDHNIRTNLTSALLLAHYLVPRMRKLPSSHILVIGSESGISAGKKGALYSSAKFGLRGLTLSLREDCARDGICVTLINPGMVDSPFFSKQNFRPGSDPSNSISTQDIADCVLHVLNSDSGIVYDEINLTPRNKTIEFNARS